MRILVLGGYGLIGLALCKRLLMEGYEIVGLARSQVRGEKAMPDCIWIGADIAQLVQPDDWIPHLRGIDIVINASGALQTGLKDNVAAVQHDAILALIQACEQAHVDKFVQISAPGVSLSSDTEFYRTKAMADDALKASGLSWTIFRPGLVWSPNAYGGTAFVRMLAAFPYLQPLLLADTKIQTVSISDVADAVVRVINGTVPDGDYDLVTAEPRSLREIVLSVRNWLGFEVPRTVWNVPPSLGGLSSVIADVSGWFGWRPAVRSSALKVLSRGVLGNSAAWTEASGQQLSPLDETLRASPSTAQERIYARAMLVFPVLVLVLAGFWIVSGVIGLARLDAATAMISDMLTAPGARVFVVMTSLLDILIGVLMLFRPSLRTGCVVSMLVALGYLIGGSIMMPELWADPVGPFVKVFPAIALALIVWALAEER